MKRLLVISSISASAIWTFTPKRNFCSAMGSNNGKSGGDTQSKTYYKKESLEDLKKRLTPMQFYVTQEKGTERAFTGEYNKNKDKGKYYCIVCDNPLFE